MYTCAGASGLELDGILLGSAADAGAVIQAHHTLHRLLRHLLTGRLVWGRWNCILDHLYNVTFE